MQRLGSALQLNVHFHVLVPDGAFDDDGVFMASEPPDDADVRAVLLRAGRREPAQGRHEPQRSVNRFQTWPFFWSAASGRLLL